LINRELIEGECCKTKKLSIEFEDRADAEKLIAKAKEIILQMESHINIIDESLNWISHQEI
jgi:hypothetical protein